MTFFSWKGWCATRVCRSRLPFHRCNPTYRMTAWGEVFLRLAHRKYVVAVELYSNRIRGTTARSAEAGTQSIILAQCSANDAPHDHYIHMSGMFGEWEVARPYKFLFLPMVDPTFGYAFDGHANEKVLPVAPFSSGQERWFDMSCINIHNGKKYKMVDYSKEKNQRIRRTRSCFHHNLHAL